MKRRISSTLMALVLVFGLLPATVFAAEGETTDPFASAKTIFVSKAGGGDGTEASPMTLPEAIKFINSYTPEDGEVAPAFIISLTGESETLECMFSDNDPANILTLNKHATRILGNGHSIETNRTITTTGKGTRVDLGKPDGTDTLIINVGFDSAPTLAIYNGAEMHMYAGVTVNHVFKPEENSGNEQSSNTFSDSAINLSGESNFYMHGGRVSNCATMKATILVAESHVEIHGGTICDNTVWGKMLEVPSTYITSLLWL